MTKKSLNVYMHKLASEVLDFTDDNGELIRQTWPNYEDIPTCIKQASLRPNTNHQYALIDGEFKKFALHDQGNVYLSLLYFSHNQDKLPEDLRKEAAANIEENLTRWKDPIPKELDGIVENLKSKGVEVVTRSRGWGGAGTLENIVNDKGDTNAGKTLANKHEYDVREGESVFDRWCHTKHDTQKVASTSHKLLDKYPVDTFAQVKQASNYFLENWREFEPKERREYCEKLAQRMEDLGITPVYEIQKYGSATYGFDCELNTMLRKQFVVEDQWTILESLVEKIAQVEPETYAEALETFDKEFQLERFWDSRLPDPYKSTFGLEKVGEEWRYNYRDCYISEGQLAKLELFDLKPILGMEVAQEFIYKPKKTFEKLPNDKKYVVARLAQNERDV